MIGPIWFVASFKVLQCIFIILDKSYIINRNAPARRGSMILQEVLLVVLIITSVLGNYKVLTNTSYFATTTSRMLVWIYFF